uniref:Toll-like receptor 6 n=1 Tax=Crassostrea virginica TaxID=6565 RepID=A0A8B8BFE9_CRAVI|nr:toll-like receptor 6 [Crassostrea virginica]XP_022302086.1 toll-like receptor 6 [Crassostrea virginica]
MEVKYCIMNLILLLSCIFGGRSEKCPLNSVCRCRKFEGKLFADCSDRFLSKAPTFSDDIIGINFAKNKFSTIPQNLPTSLLHLEMSRNELVYLNSSSFKRYTLLQNLSVSHNILLEMSIGTLKSNSRLKHLDVSHNNLLTLEVMYNISVDLKESQIQTLILEKLQCTYGVSLDIKQYQVIHLKHTQLLELNLASNRINSLEIGVLNALPKSLRILNIADNKLSFGLYIMEFTVLHNLEILNVSFQNSFHQMKMSGDAFDKCNDTKIAPPCSCTKDISLDMIIRENDIGNTTSTPRNWNHYTDTILAAESFFPFSSDYTVDNYTIYLPRNLRVFYYHDNLYKMSIPKFPFGLNNKLTHIFAQRNIFYEIIGPVTGISQLQYADLSGNFCKNISKSLLQPFSKLEFLNLSNNALAPIFENDKQGEMFRNQRLLSVLDLSFNRIVHLPERVLQNNINIRHLDLSFNSLSEFKVNIEHMKKLKTLELSNNQLVELDSETRKSLDRLPLNSINIHLIENNLKCSCETLDFLKWMRNSKNVHFVKMKDYTCSFGRNANASFKDLDTILQKLEKTCSSYTLIIVLMTTFIIITMTTTISRILYRFRWKLRYMYYVAKEKYKEEVDHLEFRRQRSFRFDAFISYADEDRRYIIDLVKTLEKDYCLSLCIHNRDFIPGTGIADNITNAIHCSRRTVCFMTKHFLDSYWCMFELNMARMEAIYSRNGQNVLFLVALDSGIMKRLPLQLMDLVDSKSYLEFPSDEERTWDTESAIAFTAKLGETLTSD